VKDFFDSGWLDGRVRARKEWGGNVHLMKGEKRDQERLKIGFSRGVRILAHYAQRKVLEQVRSVALVVLYLFFFQTMVLGLEIVDASAIAVGLAVIVVGLTLFMEGLVLGIMPLGEVMGVRLPEKGPIWIVLSVAFVLGVGATFAEPAIGILKNAGEGVRPWEAPLLFLMLHRYPHYVIWAVGAGVGLAVLCGMLRYLRGWSLKPFLYVLVTALLALTGWACTEPKLGPISGLSWDCGAVTTGPVTVPLILALGIGVCRVVGRGGSESSGFGVVTLASLFPILSVLLLGVGLSRMAPEPMSRADFYRAENRARVVVLFSDENELVRHVLENASEPEQISFFDGSKEKLFAFLGSLRDDEGKRRQVFGEDPAALERWAIRKGTKEHQLLVLGRHPESIQTSQKGESAAIDGVGRLIRRNVLVSFQAVVPLVCFLLLVLVGILRERLPQSDEVILGILLALAGMVLFNIGMEIGLTKLGNQVGQRLPSSFKPIELPEKKSVIEGFDETMVQRAIDEKGKEYRFFFLKRGTRVESLPFEERNLDREARRYVHVPRKGPILGAEKAFEGFVLVVFFALIMGYGATLAEPALNALGIAVEEITVGTFKKGLLMHAVALGVGCGMALGVLKVVLGIPLFWLLAPLYALALLLTKLSEEELVNIAWDSGGVTTGPVTVPLVLAMGLGLGSELEVVEAFGVLAMASVCPIVSVLLVALRVGRKEKVGPEEPFLGLGTEGGPGS